MKRQPPQDGMAAAEILYSEREQETDSKLANSAPIFNDPHPRPSIIPGIEYPTSPKGERIAELTWAHCTRYWMRIITKLAERVEDDRQLSVFRDKVAEFRKELVQ